MGVILQPEGCFLFEKGFIRKARSCCEYLTVSVFCELNNEFAHPIDNSTAT